MTNFDDTLRKAEAALMQKKARKPYPNAVPNAVTKPVTPAATTVSDDDFVVVNGIAVTSKEYVDEQNKLIRDDLNEVLDNFTPANVETPPMRIEIVSDSVKIGSIDGLTHFQLPDLLKILSIKDARGMRMNVMLKGEMGSGKSTACKQIAEALGLKFGYIGQTLMPHDVMGYVSQVDGKYYDTPFTRIFEHGGVIVFEELDGWSPNATLVLNPALANGYITLPDGRLVDRHPDCVIVACTNTWGTGPTATYVGRNKLDDAFLDRFGVKTDWMYDAKLERAAAGNDEVVDMVQTARANAKRMGLKVAISPRSSIDIAKLVAAGFTMRDAVRMNFGSSLDADQRRMVLEGCDI